MRESASVRRSSSSASERSTESRPTRPSRAISPAVRASCRAVVPTFSAALSARPSHADGGRATTAVVPNRSAMTPTIRNWRPADPVMDHIAEIYREFGLVFDPGFESDLVDVAASYATGAFWVAEHEGRLVATAAVVPHGPARLVKRIYVARDARRLGLARTLLRRAMAWGRFARTELWSDVRFRNAHRLYLSEGFTPGPVRVLADPDRSVERYFSKV